VTRALALAVTLLLAACTTRVGDLTVASSRKLPHRFEVVRANVEGRTCAQFILFVPFGHLNPSYGGAIDAALEGIPEADALADATVMREFFFTLFYNRTCVRVVGDAVRSRH
jgi:hypothetical protein